MSGSMEHLLTAIPIGMGATALMDVVAVIRKHAFSVPSADYGLVGRWLAYMLHGRFRHDPIAASPPVPSECLIGWSAHYLIGIAFGSLLLLIWGREWACHPTIGPGLIVGIGSVAAPFLLMQPGMGNGIAASRTPQPAVARLRSLITHAIFGVGLYAAGLAANWLGLVTGCSRL